MKEVNVDLGNNKILNLSVNDSELYFSDEPEETWVDVEIYDKESSEDSLYLRLTGPTKDNIEIDWGWDTWDDPGDYPCGIAGGPLPSYDYAFLEGASFDFKPEYFDVKILNVDGDEQTPEVAKEHYELTEEELDKVIKAARELVFEFIKDDVSSNLDQFEDWVRLSLMILTMTGITTTDGTMKIK